MRALFIRPSHASCSGSGPFGWGAPSENDLIHVLRHSLGLACPIYVHSVHVLLITYHIHLGMCAIDVQTWINLPRRGTVRCWWRRPTRTPRASRWARAHGRSGPSRWMGGPPWAHKLLHRWTNHWDLVIYNFPFIRCKYRFKISISILISSNRSHQLLHKWTIHWDLVIYNFLIIRCKYRFKILKSILISSNRSHQLLHKLN